MSGNMSNKKQQEQRNEQNCLYKYNNITEKVKTENQNQQHNVRKEGLTPMNQKR